MLDIYSETRVESSKLVFQKELMILYSSLLGFQYKSFLLQVNPSVKTHKSFVAKSYRVFLAQIITTAWKIWRNWREIRIIADLQHNAHSVFCVKLQMAMQEPKSWVSNKFSIS